MVRRVARLTLMVLSPISIAVSVQPFLPPVGSTFPRCTARRQVDVVLQLVVVNVFIILLVRRSVVVVQRLVHVLTDVVIIIWGVIVIIELRLRTSCRRVVGRFSQFQTLQRQKYDMREHDKKSNYRSQRIVVVHVDKSAHQRVLSIKRNWRHINKRFSEEAVSSKFIIIPNR